MRSVRFQMSISYKWALAAGCCQSSYFYGSNSQRSISRRRSHQLFRRWWVTIQWLHSSNRFLKKQQGALVPTLTDYHANISPGNHVLATRMPSTGDLSRFLKWRVGGFRLTGISVPQGTWRVRTWEGSWGMFPPLDSLIRVSFWRG